ncbi:pyocin knob domain-containing protein [Vreelandella venusta]|uniref:pyocin knob domain-containing protein n=1 Tax=Vreelandella venusta TaxID=44935 RepID=UPI003F66F601
MAAPTNYDQTNEWLAEVDRRVQDLINILKGGIDVGQSGTLGNLALIDTLSDSPIGNLSALQQSLQVENVAGRGVVGSAGDLMAEGAFGLGATTVSEVADLNSVVVSGYYRAGASTLNKPPGSASLLTVHVEGFSYAFVTQVVTDRAFAARRWFRVLGSGDNNWSPWFQLYNSHNILGSVSQSNGVPAGAVIERGSNDDGKWMKLTDGTMICRMTCPVDLSVGAWQYFSYPQTFSSQPGLSWSFTGTLATHYPHWKAIAFTSSGLGNFRGINNIQGTNLSFVNETESVEVTAVGEWI